MAVSWLATPKLIASTELCFCWRNGKTFYFGTRRMTMARSDFVWIVVDESLETTNPFVTREFEVEGRPIDTGYLLIQVLGVEVGVHRIFINDEPLPSFDIAPQEGEGRWTTWMDRIPEGFLQQGRNTITIRAASATDRILTVADPFHVANVAVHWRERD
jgi:hypothetical protein